MLVEIEIAWIAAGSVVAGAAVGVAGAVITAGLGLRTGKSTTAATIAASSADIRAQIEAGSVDVRAQLASGSADIRAQIEADRSNRVWEKQAATYTDSIEGIFHRQRIRGAQLQAMIAHLDPPPKTPAPVDWPGLEARIIAYSSQEVLDAFRAAGVAGSKFEYEVNIWSIRQERLIQEMAANPERTVSSPSNRNAAQSALEDANRLDDVLMSIIRAELHAGATAVKAQSGPLISQPRPDTPT
jgi:hypothetical protein